MKTLGFSLIECIVYCFLVSILSLLIFKFFIIHSSFFIETTHKQQQTVSLHALIDLLIRDIQLAHTLQIQSASGVQKFVLESITSIVWYLDNGRLYRAIDKSTAVLAKDVKEFSINFLSNSDHKNIKITILLDFMNNAYVKVVPLINRSLT